MSPCVPSSALDKQHLENDFVKIMTGTSFQGFDVHSTIIDTDVPFILTLGVNI
jgi:hypothetical protein